MANTRLTVVVRKDLQLPEGLLAAQVTHAAMEFIRDMIDAKNKMHPLTEIQKEWIKTPYISVLAVNCSEDLSAIIELAAKEKLETNIWEDTIPSPTFEGTSIKAVVAVAIGPDDFDKIKIVTSGLPLY